MKYFMFALLIASSLHSQEDNFPYDECLGICHDHFKIELCRYSDEQVYPDDLKTDEDRTIFYSGCLYSLEHLMSAERRY